MNRCAFEQIEGLWTCSNCGWIYPLTSDKPPLRPCPQEAAERLGVTVSDAAHYLAALVRWTASGFPTRSPAEVAAIFAEHCGPCDHQVAGRCARCRCRVSASGLPIENKIAMASEHCPFPGKW